ncbi:MAG: flagellar protein FlgN [Desulfobacteraceae bacterium]|nr:flagellar protein FlgN [Desulfobacteraceae bacterium]
MNAAQPIPPELFETLERQTVHSEQLLAVLEEELQVLTRMDIQELIGLTRRKESLLKRLQLLDSSFEEIARGCCPGVPGPVSLKEIIARSLPEEASRLEGHRVRLVALRHKIQDRNLVNKQLAGDILGFLSDAISLITGPPPPAAYGTRGMVRPPARPPVFISRGI